MKFQVVMELIAFAQVYLTVKNFTIHNVWDVPLDLDYPITDALTKGQDARVIGKMDSVGIAKSDISCLDIHALRINIMIGDVFC